MPIKLHSATNKIIEQQESTDKINRLFDDEFTIFGSKYDFSFSDTNLSVESKIYIRHAIVEICGGYGENNSLSPERNTSIQSEIRYLLKFVDFLKQRKVVHFIDEFNKKLYLDFIEYCIVEGGYSKATIHIINITFSKIADFCAMGDLNWFTPIKLPLPDLTVFAKETYEKHYPDEDPLKWLYGGSYQKVTFTTSMYMLAYSIQELESNLHCILSAYFSLSNELGQNWLMNKSYLQDYMKVAIDNITIDVNELTDIIANGKDLRPRHYAKYKISAYKASSQLQIWMDKTNELLPDERDKYTITTFLSEIRDLEITSGKLSDLVFKMAECSLSIIAILTGYRAHEFVNMKGVTLSKEKGEILVTTDIDKTHFGFPVSRTSNSTVEMAINSLINLSYID
ncbi:hypothetical protein, partial [Photobacterium sanguinicancri]